MWVDELENFEEAEMKREIERRNGVRHGGHRL
jgi:hypothetical protein